MSINTAMSTFSIVSKRDKSVSRLKKSPNEDGFPLTFNANCREAEMEHCPTVTVLVTEPVPWVSQALGFINEKSRTVMPATSRVGQVPSDKRLSEVSKASGKTIIMSEILAIYNNPENEGLINMLVCKHYPMQDALMGVLQKTLVDFTTLKVLKLEYCNLTANQLRGVKFILLQNENIIELSLDGNPMSYQNHYILLKDTNLQYLSLKFCKINITGITRIAINLQYPSAKTLFGLDLSNNFVKDDGCKSMAEALRTNRTLTHLSLANNLIGDEGCAYLMEVLQKFPLTHAELLFRRKCNMEYLLRRKIALEEAREEKPQDFQTTKLTDMLKPEKKSRASVMGIKSRKEKSLISTLGSSSTGKRFKRKNSIPEASLSDLAIPKDPHPYMHECVAEDMKVLCTGNYQLIYLNLAYNNITCNGIKTVKDALKQQRIATTINGGLKGLSKLRLEGNFVKNCQLVKDVADMLQDTDTRSENSRVSSAVEFRRSNRKIATISGV